MLMSTQATRYAHRLLDLRAEGGQTAPLSFDSDLRLADGYAIAKSIHDIRVAQGELPAGRKLAFTNRTIWPKYGLHEPITTPLWAPIFDTTIRYAHNNRGVQSLTGAVQPRVEPELVFKLGKTPAADATLEDIADCIEWMAHAFEVVVCPYPNWKFEAADAIAAFGLHGTLIVGEPMMLTDGSRRHLDAVLAGASVSMTCDGELHAAGFGDNVMESPVHALWHLHQVLKEQPEFAPLAAGEIITTGTWTDAHPVAPGQTWVSAFSGISLPGLTVSFVR
ncbi:MAG TPA: fumarylacetoacetate hydrolase family protein [Paucimonas sp.]|nr:fumarylacetoacetate hydrolase family protein [Paucimonas sp.]